MPWNAKEPWVFLRILRKMLTSNMPHPHWRNNLVSLKTLWRRLRALAKSTADDVKEQFRQVVNRFKEEEKRTQAVDSDEEDEITKVQLVGSDDEKADDDDEDANRISGKQRRLMRRPTVTQLKAMCRRPDIVEVWDTTAGDPYTLIWMKGLKNTVMAPRHWSEKRRYLAGRKGSDKLPYKLPPCRESVRFR
eukprot:GHVO01045470.1.p1 GENE.GHVO01045470.1~~GHVO01045470.1.p1  ORF type:complete len:191 (-),score=31.99 GHVO01045470.1:292-864(-)